MTPEGWIWTDHICIQMSERKIPGNLIESALNAPDDTIPTKQSRLIYQKKIDNKLIRVVTEGNKVITAYITNKVKKYTRE